MSKEQIIRAWKDKDYRDSLSEVEKTMLPKNPADVVELKDSELESIAGGPSTTCVSSSNRCCRSILS